MFLWILRVICFVACIFSIPNLYAIESVDEKNRQGSDVVNINDSTKANINDTNKLQKQTVIEKVIAEVEKVESNIKEYEKDIAKADDKKEKGLLRSSSDEDKDKPNNNISEAFNKLNFETFQVNPETLTGSLDIDIGKIIVNPLTGESFDLSVTNRPGLPKNPLSPKMLNDKNAFTQSDIALQLGNQFVLNLPNITVNMYTLDSEGSADKPFILSQVLSLGSVFQDFTAYSSSVDKSGKEDRLVFTPSDNLTIINPYDKYKTEFSLFKAIPSSKGTKLTRPYDGFEYIDQSGVIYKFGYRGYTSITRDIKQELGEKETLVQSYYRLSRITYPNQTELSFDNHLPDEGYEKGNGYLYNLKSIKIKYNDSGKKIEKRVAEFIYNPSSDGGLKELQRIIFNPASKEEKIVEFNYNRNGNYYNLEKITLEDDHFPQSYKFSYNKDNMLSITYPSGEKDTFKYLPLRSMTPWNDGYRCDDQGAGALIVQPSGDDISKFCKNFAPRQILSEVTRWDSHGKQVFVDHYDIVKPGDKNQIKISTWNAQAKYYEDHITNVVPTYYGSASFIEVKNNEDAETMLKKVKNCFDEAELKHYDPMLSCAQYYKTKEPSKIFAESGITESYWFEYTTKHIRDYYHSEDDDIIEYTKFSTHRPVAKLSAQGNIKDILSYQKAASSKDSIFEIGLKGYFTLEAYLYDGEGNYWKNDKLASSFSGLSKNYDKPVQIISRQFYQPNKGEITPLNGLLTLNTYENNYGQLIKSDEYQLAINSMEPFPQSLIIGLWT